MPAGFADKLQGRAIDYDRSAIKLTVQAATDDATLLVGKYSQTFIDELARQITQDLCRAASVKDLGTSTMELELVFAPGTYLEHTSENVTYRRLLLVDKGCQARDFWVKWTRLDGKGGFSYTYGGDHGELLHDGCFCVDGLVYPDRRLHTGAKQMKNVYRPVRAFLEDGKLVFLNTNRFRNTSYITAVWEIVKNGNNLLAVDEAVMDIAPEEKIEIPFEFRVPKEKCDCHVNIYYYCGDDEIAFEQITLKEEFEFKPEKSADKLKIASDCKKTFVFFDNGSVTFSSENGMIESYVVNKKETINNSPAFANGFIPNIYRAYLDNDTRFRDEWIEAGYDDYACILTDFEAELEKNKAEIEVSYKLKSNKNGKILAEVEIEYEVYDNGCIKVEAEFKPVSFKKLSAHMPRFGLTLEMNEAFRNIEYFGMGECENLSDLYAQSIIGVYNSTVEDMHEPYIRPQDSGNRCSVRYLKVTDSEGDGLKFVFDDDYFNFNAREFTQKLLQKAAHQENLHDEHTTVINIDGFTRGTGTASCGPDILPQFEVDGSKGLEFSFYMMPADK